jgi:hypothetical protein
MSKTPTHISMLLCPLTFETRVQDPPSVDRGRSLVPTHICIQPVLPLHCLGNATEVHVPVEEVEPHNFRPMVGLGRVPKIP